MTKKLKWHKIKVKIDIEDWKSDCFDNNFLFKDNDDFKTEDWAIVENMPNPTFGDIEKYYYMQQRVLRGDKIPRELNWMKKLKTSLWKGLKPDPLPVALPKPQQ